MKAISLQAIGQVRLVDLPVPEPADDQLLIRTAASTICTSDLNDIRANPFGTPLPVVLGHEAAGSVAAVGRAVRSFAPGERVATHPVHPCLQCSECRAGRAHLCPDMKHFGLNMQGTFAEYYLVRADRARRLPAAVPWHVAALAEPLCVCLQALAQSRVAAGGSLLIIGDGPFGLIMARLAARLRLGRLVLAGGEEFRLGHAGAATTLNVTRVAAPREALARLLPEHGCDAAIVAVGAAEAIAWGTHLVRPKGRVVLFAGIPGLTPVDLFGVHLRELELVGANNDEDRFDEAVALLDDRQLALADLVTHCLPWQRYDEALELAAHRHDVALKVALLWNPEEPP